MDFGTNAEMRWDSVAPGKYLTDPSRLFVRDHTSTPRIDARSYRLAVFGDGLRESRTEAGAVSLSLADLRSLPRTTITAVHECTGNGRSYFDTQQGTPAAGTQWTLGAVGAVTWEGVRLADVFARIGLAPEAVDVMATGLDPHYVPRGVDYGAVRRPFPVAQGARRRPAGVGDERRDAAARPRVPAAPGAARLGRHRQHQVARLARGGPRQLTSPWNTKWYRMTGGVLPGRQPAADRAPGAHRAGSSAVARPAGDAGRRAARPLVERRRSDRERRRQHRRRRTWRPARLTGPGRGVDPVAVPLAGGRRRGEHALMARATDVTGRTQPLVTPYNDGGYFFDAVVRQQVRVA